MSKELIERLREGGKFLGGNFGKLMHEAADALEAKAAPVGEREAAIEAAYAAVRDGGWDSVKDMGIQMFQAGAAYQRAQQPQSTDWKASGADWCSSIHSNPDAEAWADFFVATFPGLADKHDLMLGWFANAMMAMHDYLKAQQPQSAEAAVPQWRYDALIQHAKHQDKVIAKLSEEKNTAWLYEQKEVWFWQGDGEDYPESLCCPVVIKADDLRALIAAATPQPSAGVVMPERKTAADFDFYIDSFAAEAAEIHNRVIDEFARLNGKEVGRE